MGEKADGDLVRRQNRQLVLEALRRHGPSARIELGRLTGLSPASLTSISAQLIADNAIHELNGQQAAPGDNNTKRGRPIVKLALNASAAHVVAVKLQVDRIDLALADFRGVTVAERFFERATFTMKREEIGATLADAIPAFVRANGVNMANVARIGVAVPGPADSRAGVMSWSPAFRERQIPVRAPIEEAFGIPCLVANDSNMMAEGLAASDPPIYEGITAAVFMGYGVGTGLFIDGRLYDGGTGAATELGHMNHIPQGAMCRCGRRGCLEAYTADYAIVRMAEGGDAAQPPPATAIPPGKMAHLAEQARAGNAKARKAFEEAGTALGFGLARMMALINPNRIVISGPWLDAFEFIEPAMRKAIDDAIIPELTRSVTIEYTPFVTDLIVRGTIEHLLAEVDRQVFASGPLAATSENLEPAI